MNRIRALLAELTRRKVLQSVGGYVVLVWLLAQGFADLFPYFGLPDWTLRAFVYGGVALLPVVAFVSWRYNLTTQGFVRDSPGEAPLRRRADDATLNEIDATEFNVRGVLMLHWQSTDGEKQSHQCYGPTIIGRDKACDVRLADPRVSRRHAEITAIDGRWGIRDMDSANGTWLDDGKITSVPLPTTGVLRFDRQGPQIVFSIEADDSTIVSPAESRSPED